MGCSSAVPQETQVEQISDQIFLLGELHGQEIFYQKEFETWSAYYNEYGLSLPDISLLQPMAEMMEVSVTELLSGRYIEETQSLSVEEVEPLVTGTLTMTVQEQAAQRAHRRQWGMWYLSALACMIVELMMTWHKSLPDEVIVFTYLGPLMAAAFGAYLIFFAKEKLPVFYDQYRLDFYSDGVFRMNVPGVHFNNRNWPHILHVLRVWACLTMAGWIPAYGLVDWAVSQLLAGNAMFAVRMILGLSGILTGMFIPVYVVGKKYE